MKFTKITTAIGKGIENRKLSWPTVTLNEMQTESQYSVSQEKVTLLGRDYCSIDRSQLRPTKNEINSLNTNLNKKDFN